MLSDEKKTILKVLIAMAWADGHVDKEELEIVEALLDAFNTGPDEAGELREWAATRRTIDEIDVSGLTHSDMCLALQHGVLLSYIDGDFSAEERTLIEQLIDRFGLTRAEAQPLLDSAEAFARSLLPELQF